MSSAPTPPGMFEQTIGDFNKEWAYARAHPEPLDEWLREAANSGIHGMRRFVATRRDLAAVRNAISTPWSNGQIEGQINRLKTLKRSMYGRTGVKLLRSRHQSALFFERRAVTDDGGRPPTPFHSLASNACVTHRRVESNLHIGGFERADEDKGLY